MPEVRLPAGLWTYDEGNMLGPPGGFGAVFRGRGADGKAVAIKRLQSPFQVREMRIADYLLGHGLAHVIPILDAGFDDSAGTNFIVMPIAETSLQQHISASEPVSEKNALEILTAVAAGLNEIGDIIHRDLKPGNILLHDGVWKLADLGLARFAEAATSLNTMREALTPPYAAPEQWRGERPTKATDIYAIGCIAHALLNGTPPFSGPESADYGHQHQFVAAPVLNASPHLKRLTAACLAKSPELRPSVLSLRKQLNLALTAIDSSRANRLAAAGALIIERAALEEEERLRGKREEELRKRVATEAVELLQDTFKELEAAVLCDAPNAEIQTNLDQYGLRGLRLGPAAYVEYGVPFHSNKTDPYPRMTGRQIGSETWDVFAGGYIYVGTKGVPEYGQSANLWFGRLLEGDDYRWWEVSYVYPSNSTLEEHLREPEPFGRKTLASYGLYGRVARSPTGNP